MIETIVNGGGSGVAAGWVSVAIGRRGDGKGIAAAIVFAAERAREAMVRRGTGIVLGG